MKIKALFFASLFFSANFFATELSPEDIAFFNSRQDSMAKYIRQSVFAKTEEQRFAINEEFSRFLDEAFNHERAYAFSFDSLRQFKMLISADDKLLRIITWNIPKDDKTQIYFGYVQHYNSKKKQWQTFKLTDKSDEIKNAEMLKLTDDNWFGAYYYKIVTKKHKKKTYYTLLGWDGNTRITQRKIIDVLYFDAAGQPYFGEEIFEVQKTMGKTDKKITVWQKRVIFEFKQGVTMALKFDTSTDAIVFDHLSPEDSSQKGMYQFYGPDLSYSAYLFKKGKWIFVENADARNDKNQNKKDFNNPEGNN